MFKCDICGKGKTGKSYTMTLVGEAVCCRDCYRQFLNDLENEVKNLLK